MSLEIKQNLKLSQQLVMTPQLQQAIKLLQLTRMELQEMVNQEMLENPILEEATEPEELSQTHLQAQAEDVSTEDKEWDHYLEELSADPPLPTSKREIPEDELPYFENALIKTTSLEEHLLWQLSMLKLAPAEKVLGELIVGNLTEDGYLQASLPELATEANLELEDAEELLKMIQNFDPLGTGSRNLQECLLAQARFLSPPQPLVEELIENHLLALEKKNYALLVKKLNCSLEAIQQAAQVVLSFEPKPGRSFRAGETHYISPDIYIYKVGEEYAILLNEDGMPKLRISPYYKKILSAKTLGDSKPTKQYVQEKLRSAIWFIRSIHNRQKTIYKVAEAIVNRQKEFFEKGIHFLKPMILKDVADDLGMHESTISRVTTNKFVHTPQGIFELKYFFNSSIQTTDGTESLASQAVKEKIKQLIQKEDPKRPLSDQQIADSLKQNHITLARRTVAKYRELLGILASSQRKKYF